VYICPSSLAWGRTELSFSPPLWAIALGEANSKATARMLRSITVLFML